MRLYIQREDQVDSNQYLRFIGFLPKPEVNDSMLCQDQLPLILKRLHYLKKVYPGVHHIEKFNLVYLRTCAVS